jgi:hypothetical protein
MDYDDSDDNDHSNSGNGKLPVSPSAVPARRGTHGAQYARIDHRSGAITFGRDDTPLPLNHLYTVPWREVSQGYKEFRGKSVTNTVMKPVFAGPCPQPPGDYAPYGVDGPRPCMELRLCSLTEPGFAVVYSCLNESGTSRMLDLWGEIAAQYSVTTAFANPVVSVGPDSYTNQYGTTFCLAYTVKDWLGDDGATLLSKAKAPEGDKPF